MTATQRRCGLTEVHRRNATNSAAHFAGCAGAMLHADLLAGPNVVELHSWPTILTNENALAPTSTAGLLSAIVFDIVCGRNRRLS